MIKSQKKNPRASFSSVQSPFLRSSRNMIFRVKPTVSTFVFVILSMSKLDDFQRLNIHPTPFIATLQKSSGSPKDTNQD